MSVQFIRGIVKEFETDGNATTSKQNIEHVSRRNVNNFKTSMSNKEFQMHEQMKHDLQTKTSRKNQIEHYFNIVDRQLQSAMKKKMSEC